MIKGTRVTVFGLTSHPELNHAVGVIEREWDGTKYAVRLSSTVVRVGLAHVTPIDVNVFVELQRRLSFELHVYANMYSDYPNSSLCHIEKTRLEPMQKALDDCATRVELCRVDGRCVVLRLYADDAALPHVQLRPMGLTTPESVAAYNLAVDDFNVVTLLADALDGDDTIGLCAASQFCVTCGGASFIFLNEYPLFLQPLARLDALTSSRMAPVVSANTLDIIRFCKTIITSMYYSASEGVLLFETKDHKCRIVSFQWSTDAFVLARCVWGSHHQMRVLALLEHSSFATPMSAASQHARIFPNKAVALLDGAPQLVARRLRNGSLCLENGSLVSGGQLRYDAACFLMTQVILMSHVLEYMKQKRRAEALTAEVTKLPLVLYHEMLASIRQVLRTGQIPHICNNRFADMLNENHAIAGQDFILPYAFMEGVTSDADELLCWLANMESLTHLLISTHGMSMDDVELAMEEDDRVCVARFRDQTIRIGDFSLPPLMTQALVVKRQMEDMKGLDSLMDVSLQECLSTDDIHSGVMTMILSNNFNFLDEQCGATDATGGLDSSAASAQRARKRVDKGKASGSTTPGGCDAAEAERRRMLGDELIREEEAGRGLPTGTPMAKASKAPAKARKKKKSAKQKPTSVAAMPVESAPTSAASNDETQTGQTIPTPCGDDPSDASSCPSQAASVPSSTESEYTLVLKSRVAKSMRQLETERNALAKRVEQLVEESEQKQQEMLMRQEERRQLAAERDACHAKLEVLTARCNELEEEKGTLMDDVGRLTDETHSLQQTRKENENWRRDQAAKIKDAKRDCEASVSAAQQAAAEARKFEDAARAESDAIRVSNALLQQQLTERKAQHEQERRNHKRKLMDKLYMQLVFYLKGHYMKLSPNSLSTNALLLNGFVAKNTIEFYMLVDPAASERDVVHQLPKFFDDVTISGDAIIFAT